MVHATIRLMRRSPSIAALITSVACIALLASGALVGGASRAQDESASAVLLELVNQVRLDEGLDPYGRSRLLSSAAQRHADDLAENGLVDPNDVHRGSDGTDEQERIEQAGYTAWTLDDGDLVVGENVWLGEGTPQDALGSFLEDAAYRDNLLHDGYREVGIGAATDGGGRSVYVLDFGARPNVLPIFVNDGAPTTENREVAVRLTNERVRPGGQGAGFMGEAIEIRLSNDPSFENLAWQSWAPLVSWMLPDSVGDHTVYVQFRDAAGRTAASADSIFLDMGTPTTPTAVPLPATLTARAAGTASAGPTPESGGTPEPSPLGATPEPTTLPPESSASPSSSPVVTSRETPFPTWTPLPSPEPTSVDRDEAGEAVLSLPHLEGYGRPLVIVGILQGVVIILSVFWMARHGKGV